MAPWSVISRRGTPPASQSAQTSGRPWRRRRAARAGRPPSPRRRRGRRRCARSTRPRRPPRASAARSASGKRTSRDVVAHRAEVVDLGAVGGVVVDDDEQPQAAAAPRSRARQRHERPPSPSAATVMRSGRATAAPIAQPSPSPTAWKPLMNTHERASATSRYIAGQPMKWPESTATARVGGSRSASAIGERARVDRTVGAGVRVGLVAPAAGGDRAATLGGAAARRRAPRALELGDAAPRPPPRGVADDGEVGRAVRADRARVDVDLDDRAPAGRSARRGASSSGSASRRTRRRRRPAAAARRPAATRTRPRSRARTGRPAKSPLAIAEVASSAPVRAPSASIAGARVGRARRRGRR